MTKEGRRYGILSRGGEGLQRKMAYVPTDRRDSLDNVFITDYT